MIMKNHPNDSAGWPQQANSFRQRNRRDLVLLVSILGSLLFSFSCGKSETPRDAVPAANESAIEPPAHEAQAPESPSYDLRTVGTYQQAIDQDGRTVEETYAMPDGKMIKISYDWEGGSNRCRKATARLEGQIIAVATAVAVRTDTSSRPLEEVEEVHYSADNPQTITYKGKSLFAISLTARKTDERPVFGEKHHELFTHWGTFRSAGTGF